MKLKKGLPLPKIFDTSKLPYSQKSGWGVITPSSKHIRHWLHPESPLKTNVQVDKKAVFEAFCIVSYIENNVILLQNCFSPTGFYIHLK